MATMNWPEGDDLQAAARRGDLILQILREHGYSLPAFAVEDILASVAAAVIREIEAGGPWGHRPGATVHHGSHREVAETAVKAVDQMIEESAARLAK